MFCFKLIIYLQFRKIVPFVVQFLQKNSLTNNLGFLLVGFTAFHLEFSFISSLWYFLILFIVQRTLELNFHNA